MENNSIQFPENTYDDIPDCEWQKRDLFIEFYDSSSGKWTAKAFNLRSKNPLDNFISLTRIMGSDSADSIDSLLKYNANKIKRAKAFCLLQAQTIKDIKINQLDIYVLREGEEKKKHSGIFTYINSKLADGLTDDPNIDRLKSALLDCAMPSIQLYTDGIIQKAIQSKEDMNQGNK